MKYAALAILAANAAASTNFATCGTGDVSTALQAFMMGFQKDVTATDYECYAKTEVLGAKFTLLSEAAQDFDINDWAAPLYLLSEIAVANTDLFTYCQTTNFAKQLATRTNSLAGFFDLASTVGVAFLKH